MNTQMTTDQALQIVSDALQPNMALKISRSGYVAIEQAISVLAKAIQPSESNDSQS